MNYNAKYLIGIVVGALAVVSIFSWLAASGGPILSLFLAGMFLIIISTVVIVSGR